MERIVFNGSLEPVQQEVDYFGKQYMLVELDTPAVAEYKSAQMASVRIEEGGTRSLGGSGDLDPLLVRLGLREVLDGGKLGRMSKPGVEKLRPAFVKLMADRLREINRDALSESLTPEQLDKQIEYFQSLRGRTETPSKN